MEANNDLENCEGNDLHCLHKNSLFFKEDERQRLANKYIPIALNKLYLLLTNES